MGKSAKSKRTSKKRKRTQTNSDQTQADSLASAAIALFELFTGLSRAYGRFVLKSDQPEGDKVEGYASTVREPVTVDLWMDHLKGKEGLGIVPIRDNASCSWGAIDIDEYPLDHLALEEQITELGLPLTVCRTKSGGAHLYLFLVEPTPAESVRGVLMDWASALGYSGVEIFPKQSVLASKDDVGNWLNMPYFGGDSSNRKAMVDGDWISVETFIELAKSRSVSEQDLKEVELPDDEPTIDLAPIHEAPPCLTQLARDGIGVGSRNNGLFNLGVYLRKRYGEDDDIGDKLDDLHDQFVDPSLSNKEITQIKLQLRKKEYQYRCNDSPIQELCDKAVCLSRMYGVGPSVPTGEAAVQELNKHHAGVMVGGKFAILCDEPGQPLELLGQEAFSAWLMNRRCIVPDKNGDHKYVSVFKHWMASPERRQFRRIVFDPSESVSDENYNLWSGFSGRAQKGNCSLFLDHLRDNVCVGNKAHYEWILGWFAALFQSPTKKLGTSLVLRGKQGVGKTIVGKLIGELLGKHYLLVSNPRYVTGRFNSHLFPLLLLHADEAFWAGDKQAEGMLKDTITGDEHLLEFKYKEPVKVRNYIRLLVTSNESWVVPVGLNDRRFAVFDVGQDQIQNRDYFNAIVQQMDNGGREALLYHLLHYDYSSVPLHRIPETLAQHDQQLASFTPEQAWLADLLINGALPGDWGSQGHSPGLLLHDHYVKGAQKTGHRHRAMQMELSRFLKEWLPKIVQKRRTVILDPNTGEKSVQRVWEFPSLKDCRRAFEEMVGREIDWGPLSKWEAPPMESSDVI